MTEQIEVISDAQMWALIVGFLSPLLIATVQRPAFRSEYRVAIAVGWSLIAGGMTSWLTDDLDGKSVVSCFLVIAVTSIASYQSIWVPTKIAPWIEAKTSPGAVHVVTSVPTAPAAVEEYDDNDEAPVDPQAPTK